MKRILYIEDMVDNRDLVIQILGGRFEVFTASDGAEGLKAALSLMPDLILMDVSLPVMDGLTCTRLMREDERLKEVPIVALSAHCMVGDREKALEAGCDGFLSKPFRVAQLRELVTDFVARGRGAAGQG